MELSKLPFRVLFEILIKSWNQCIRFFTTLQEERKSIVEKEVEMSFHWGNQLKFCINSPLLLSCDSKVWHYSWMEIWVNMSIYVEGCRLLCNFLGITIEFSDKSTHPLGSTVVTGGPGEEWRDPGQSPVNFAFLWIKGHHRCDLSSLEGTSLHEIDSLN